MLNHAQLLRADIGLLLVFDLLFEEGHAGRAAARLNLSPSAVSHALRRLRRTFDDPLFLATARGMVPTARAQALAPAIRAIVEQVHGVFNADQRFDPARAVRRFRLGVPDGTMAILAPALVGHVAATAPGIDLAILQVLPRSGAREAEPAWRDVLGEIEAGRLDVAILPHRPASARFLATPLYSDDFVFASRRGHPIGPAPTIDAILAQRHVLVSATGDSFGFVDLLLAERGLERRIALSVPSFLLAAAAIAASDLIGALPRRFVLDAARTTAIALVEPPFAIPSADLHAVVARAAMGDHGIAWLVGAIATATSAPDAGVAPANAP